MITEAEILEWMKELLWDGKNALPTPEEGGVQKYICHILDDARIILCDNEKTVAINNIERLIENSLRGHGTYIGFLDSKGLVDVTDKVECQRMRMKLLDDMIVYFKGH